MPFNSLWRHQIELLSVFTDLGDDLPKTLEQNRCQRMQKSSSSWRTLLKNLFSSHRQPVTVKLSSISVKVTNNKQNGKKKNEEKKNFLTLLIVHSAGSTETWIFPN